MASQVLLHGLIYHGTEIVPPGTDSVMTPIPRRL
jgi:hypothetical protein